MFDSKQKKRLVYWFVLPVIILLVLSGIFYVYINSENFRANVKSVLLSQLKNSLGKRIEIGTVDSISFRSLQLTQFIIYENGYSEEDNILFQAEQAEAKFNLFFSLFHWKEWQLDIRDIIFYQASASVTRESTGEFDFIKKLQLEPEKIQQNIIIQRIYFQNSNLIFHDELIYNYNQEYLTTRARDINGYFDLSQLPKIAFDFQGKQEQDNTLLALQGQLLINQPEYSLDFHLENADITHFQYYLEVAEQFEVSQGQFDLDLNVSFSPELHPTEIFWKGNATLQQVDAKPHFLHQIPFNQISGSVKFTKPEISVAEITGLYHDRNVHLRGLVLVEPKVYFNLDIESERVNLSYLKDDTSLFIPDYTDFSLQGEVDLTINIEGHPEDFQIDGEASSPEITIEDTPFQKNTCSFLLHQDELIIHSLESYDPRSSLIISGLFDWSGDVPFYQFSLKTEDFSLQHPLFSQLSFLENSSGNIDSYFQIQSQEQDSSMLDIEGNFMANSIKMKDISLSEPLQGKIKAVLNFPGTLLSIEECELESGQNHGSIDGEINLDEFVHFTMDFGLQLPELTEFVISLGLEMQIAGRADIEGSFYGTLEQAETNAEFHLQELSIRDYSLGELTGELTYQKDTILLEIITLTNQDTKLTGKGEINFHASSSPEIDLSYQLHTINIDPFIQTITDTLPLSGQVAGSGYIQGIWPKLTAQGIFQLDQITYVDYVLGQGQIDFNLQPEEDILTEKGNGNLNELLSWIGYVYSLEIQNFTLQNETMKLMAEGQAKIGKDNPFSLVINFSHQDLDDMIEHFYPYDSYYKIFLPSQVTGKANLNGDFSQQQITLSAQLIPQQQQNNPPSKLESVIIRNEQGFTVSDFSLMQTEGHFKAEGSISTARVLDINFLAEQLDMNILTSLAQIDETMRGIMNIEGSLSGSIDDPQVSMTAQIKKGYFREFQFEDLQTDIRWDSETNEIEIRRLEIALENVYQIQARGNLPLSVLSSRGKQEMRTDISNLEIPLDFQIIMDNTDLNIVRLFWKDGLSEVMGKMDLELNLTGTAGNPVVNGAMKVRQGKVTLDDLPVQIEELTSSIEVSNNQVTIPPISFTVYENNFNISGQFELVHLLPENMILTIRNEQEKIIYQNILASEVDFLVEIRGSLLKPQINGQLLLSRGELNLNQLMQLYEENNISFYTPSPPDAANSYLDLNIEIADPFSLKLTNAEINVTGNIALSGSFSEPAVQGNLVLKKGHLLYFEKRFIISEGRVIISGFDINNIDINARAQTTVQDVQIMINASGNLANPQILLSSQPPLRETEILSLLTFDRNIQGLSEGEINQILSQEMFDIIFQSLQINLFKRMEREIADQLGLDFLRISTETLETSDNQFFLSDGLNLEDLRLEVGKSIRDDLFITYSTPLDFYGESSLSIDYQIAPDFTLNTQFDTYSLKDEDYRFKFGLEINF